jgi:hypothetical protein
VGQSQRKGWRGIISLLFDSSVAERGGDAMHSRGLRNGANDFAISLLPPYRSATNTSCASSVFLLPNASYSTRGSSALGADIFHCARKENVPAGRTLRSLQAT